MAYFIPEGHDPDMPAKGNGMCTSQHFLLPSSKPRESDTRCIYKVYVFPFESEAFAAKSGNMQFAWVKLQTR